MSHCRGASGDRRVGSLDTLPSWVSRPLWPGVAWLSLREELKPQRVSLRPRRDRLRGMVNTFQDFQNDSEGPPLTSRHHQASVSWWSLGNPSLIFPSQKAWSQAHVGSNPDPALTSYVMLGRDLTPLRLSFLICRLGVMTGLYKAAGYGKKCTVQCLECGTSTCLLNSNSKYIHHHPQKSSYWSPCPGSRKGLMSSHLVSAQ